MPQTSSRRRPSDGPDNPRSPKHQRRFHEGSDSGNSGFQPGTIVRVKLRNFVTYTEAEFLPGPNLNMVIGPNGTGKSSLVCAICLGLGFNPGNLGRAGTVGEFVKHGKTAASIEIELQKRPEDRENPVIQVRINREDNSRKWWINGRETTHKNVKQLTQALRIQIDNLCQFLPQDRVAEFAGLSPVDLLHETLRAAAPPEMLDLQDQLKSLDQDQKRLKVKAETDSTELRKLQGQQEGDQADVDRLNERAEIEEKIKELELTRLGAEYQKALSHHKEMKKRVQMAHDTLRQLSEDAGPALMAVEEKKGYAARVKEVVGSRKRALADAERHADKALRDIEVATTQIDELAAQERAEKNAVQTQKKSIGAVQNKIRQIEAQINQPRKPFDAQEWNTKIREQEHRLRELVHAVQQQEDKLGPIQRDRKLKEEKIARIRIEMKNLESTSGQNMKHLEKVNREVWEIVRALEKNKDRFEKEVFGPPMLTCSINDKRYSNLVQSLLQNDDFLCFTAQTRNDHKVLSDMVYQEMKMSASIRTCVTPLNSLKSRQISREELKNFGLDGFALDFLDGPEPVLAMLCEEKLLHNAGVGLRAIPEAQFKTIQDSGRMNTWAAGTQQYRVNRRAEYGSDAVNAVTRPVRQGRFWTDRPVDEGRKTELANQVQELLAECKDLEEAEAAVREEEQRIRSLGADVKGQINQLKKAKSELQMEHNQAADLPRKLDAEKTKLAECKNRLDEHRKTEFQLQSQRNDKILEKAEKAMEHFQSLMQMRNARQDLLEASILALEANSEVAALAARNQEITRRIAEEKSKVSELKAESDKAKSHAGEKKADFAYAIKDIDRDDLKRRIIEEASTKPVEQIGDEIGAEKAKLELIHAPDAGLLDRFQERALKIQKLEDAVTAHAQKTERLGAQIKEIRDRWEPRVDELIERINEAFAFNFEQISCAGEVSVAKDEDFEKWAIDIRVKFRENEALQRLDQHRQSGGERAVTTIFYLMSLQSMAQAPFRVVDEINQGMDPRNERMVHERMVDIACKEHTSQYFLITPKLLTGLKYHERMKVLCIASGEEMPVDAGKKIDFAACIAKQAQLKQRAIAGRA